ncbi:hypothetical protein [Alienimonas sp. DA493]|uniref:hypothetical protein n=1 Tax=Alienimonas sp. DA493 TaxID=3373605 RepID=UPI003753F223
MPRPIRTPTEEAFRNRNSKPASRRKLKKLAGLYGLDERSVTTLFSARLDFDRPGNQPNDGGALVPEAERDHLVRQGGIPEPRAFAREELLDWLTAAWGAVDRPALANAFIVGVANGRYDLKSALGSYASFHALAGPDRDDAIARGIRVGGAMRELPEGDETFEPDFLTLAFKRLWKPYMLHDSADYAALDLTQFKKNPAPEPTDAERENFRALLNAIRDLPPTAKLTDLQKAGTRIVKGNKYDRVHVFEILGYCDVLGSPDHPPVRERFVNQLQRPQPDHLYSRDWQFPANFWDGTVGVNEEAVAYWFPGYER